MAVGIEVVVRGLRETNGDCLTSLTDSQGD